MVGNSAFDKFLTRFEKTFGEGSLTPAADNAFSPYEVISTGSIAIDYMLGVGGLVEGRLVEIWGAEGVGKSTFAMLCLAEAHKKYPKKRTAWIDMEQVFDKPWAAAHGVPLDSLWLHTPTSAEDVADVMKEIVMSGLFSMVVLDSIGAMIPEAEKAKDADKAVMAAQAKIVTRMVKIAAVEARRSGTIPIMINQVRANLGYGADTTTGGGFALKHATTMKLKLSRTGTTAFTVKLGDESRVVGHEIKVRSERNKVAPAYRDATMVLFHQETDKYGPVGLDKADEATTMGIKLGVVQQAGAFYSLEGAFDKLRGRESVVSFFRENPDKVEVVRNQVLALTADEIVAPEDEEIEEIPDEPTPRKMEIKVK